eukprot:9954960-Alexandrium_andersonii.AAC.1
MPGTLGSLRHAWDTRQFTVLPRTRGSLSSCLGALGSLLSRRDAWQFTVMPGTLWQFTVMPGTHG